jgi:hypothetical protein
VHRRDDHVARHGCFDGDVMPSAQDRSV